MIEQLTKKQALEFHDSKEWESMSKSEIALFQLHQRLLCVPFSVFHEAVEHALSRPVFTHEFANPKSLISELSE